MTIRARRDSNDERRAITARLPTRLLAKARTVLSDRESLNNLIVEAVEREDRTRQGMRTMEEIGRIREQIREESGIQPNSTPMIRSARDGDLRRG